MRRAQIDALMDAHRGRAQTVASLYVLRQATLDDDDQTFLSEHATELELADVLRWLARSAEAGTRGAIVRALAQAAITAPERFRFEVLGAKKPLLDEHEWGEIAERTLGKVKPGLGAEIWAQVGGSPVFRALCRAGAWAPGKPLEPAFFACERTEGEGLEARVARAFEPRGAPSRQLAAALFQVRYDESACRRALARPPSGVDPARWMFELERAGRMDLLDAAALPATTVWACEERGDEDEQVRQAYVRHVALAYGGDAGLRWLVEQVEAALARGAAPAALLGETPSAVRERLPVGLAERLRGQAEGLTLGSALALGALLPAAMDEAALARRAGREAEEGDEDWGPLAALLPAGLGEAALGRARRSRRGPELVALLDWMLAQGKPRKAAFELAVAALNRGLLHRALIGWLAYQLTTRAAWEQGGAEVIGALVRSEALPELNDLLAMAWSQARRDRDDDPEPPEGFRRAVHGAFAVALHEVVGEALARGDRPRALLHASALACLDPPAHLRRRLQGPGKAQAGSDEERSELLLAGDRSGRIPAGGVRQAVHARPRTAAGPPARGRGAAVGGGPPEGDGSARRPRRRGRGRAFRGLLDALSSSRQAETANWQGGDRRPCLVQAIPPSWPCEGAPRRQLDRSTHRGTRFARKIRRCTARRGLRER